jgi:sulfite reductase beta subunit-like hemoprotein
MAAQGWCPSTYRLHAAPDGGLARVKVPGGRLTLDQAAAVVEAAARLGNGTIEITNRANLQLRGLDARAGAGLRALLGPAGLSAPTAELDDRRNVLASPAAGLDPTELLDVTPVVASIVRALDALPPLDRLPHKFGVAVDGGGHPTVRGRALDLGLGAVTTPEQDRAVLEVALGAALPTTTDPSSPKSAPETPGNGVLGADFVEVVEVGDAARLVGAAARLCAEPPSPAEPGRMADVVRALGLERTVGELATRADVTIERLAVVRNDPAVNPARAYGEVRSTDGRWSAGELRALVDHWRAEGITEVRLTPERSILVPKPSARPVLVEVAR